MLGLVTIRHCIKFEISTFTHYEDMKVDENAETGVVLGLWVTEGQRQYSHSIEHMTFYSTLIETMRLSCTVFELLSLISQNLKTSCDRDHAQSKDSL